MRQFQALLRQFGGDERGVFAVIFALLAIVLVATAGAVVDFTTIEQARARAQDALDSAALGLQRKIYDDGVTEETIRVDAEALLVERLADANVTATISDVEILLEKGMLRLQANLVVPTAFVSLVGINQITAGVVSEVRRGSLNLEVAVALDVTLSMQGSRIDALRSATAALIDAVVQDTQEPTYSKMALIPYSSAVNVDSLATAARGPVRDYKSITGAAWLTPSSSSSFTISGITKANPARITTSSNHGFSTGDLVNISNVAGGGFTALNGNSYTITVTSSTQFTLNGVSSSGFSGTYTSYTGRVTKGSTRIVSAVSKANPGQITTTMAHGLTTGDMVYVTNVAGGGFPDLNNKVFNVTVQNATQFTLNGKSTWSYWGTYTANSGVVRKCLTNECEIVMASTGHGLSENEYVWITGVDNDINEELDPPYTATDVTDDAFVLEDSDGRTLGSYSSGGRVYCGSPGCEYQIFENPDGDYKRFRITNCVTERVGADEYTDAAPSTTYVGRHYPPSAGDCLGDTIIPLTADKDVLHAAAAGLDVTGTTAGQIGTAWAWYLVAPEFGELFSEDSQKPAEYDAPHTQKIAIIMTDGIYNTPYCQGVVAQDNTIPSWGWGNPDENYINCDATNGDPLDQAESLCDAMDAAGVRVFTVGFEVGSDTDVIGMLNNCASSPGDAYQASGAAGLLTAFQNIGDSISELRLAQ